MRVITLTVDETQQAQVVWSPDLAVFLRLYVIQAIANSDLIDLEEVPAGTPGGTGINSVSFTGSIAQTAAAVPGVSATSIIGCQLKVQGGKLVI